MDYHVHRTGGTQWLGVMRFLFDNCAVNWHDLSFTCKLSKRVALRKCVVVGHNYSSEVWWPALVWTQIFPDHWKFPRQEGPLKSILGVRSVLFVNYTADLNDLSFA